MSRSSVNSHDAEGYRDAKRRRKGRIPGKDYIRLYGIFTVSVCLVTAAAVLILVQGRGGKSRKIPASPHIAAPGGKPALSKASVIPAVSSKPVKMEKNHRRIIRKRTMVTHVSPSLPVQVNGRSRKAHPGKYPKKWEPAARAHVGHASQPTTLSGSLAPVVPNFSRPQSEGRLAEARSAYIAKVRELIYIHKEYPPEARKQHLEGSCRVVCVIRRDGTIKEVELVRPAGNEILDKAAVRAVTGVVIFPPVPASIPGNEVSFDVPISFRMTEF